MITLPKSWAESMGLRKNDPVVVVPQPDGGLLLTTNSEDAMKESVKVLSVDEYEDPDALYRALIGSYIAGHDQIRIDSDGPIKGSYLEAISQFTQTSMGMEIVEEEEDRILIKDLINHSEAMPQKNVKREYLLVKRMIADALSAFPPTAAEMDARDTEVDRIHWLVQRQASIHLQNTGLSSRTGLSLATMMSCMGVSKTLERMGDHAVLLVKNRPALDDSDRKRIAENLELFSPELQNYIGEAMDSWMGADAALAERVIRRKKTVLSTLRKCFAEISNKDAGNMLYGSLNRIVDYCSDMAESAINLAMEKN